jgi:uncharacterized protein (DUF1697 family)
MKYVALLRGVNVGGKNTVKMSDLKKTFEKSGFTNVSTYINSGNVMFESEIEDVKKLTRKIDLLLQKKFAVIKTVVLSDKQLKDVIGSVPKTWKTGELRKYIAFVKSPSEPEDIIKEAQLKEGVDSIDKGPGVVYMSTKLAGITKSGFPKLIAKQVYKNITLRNFSTAQKLLSYMEEK